MKKKIIIFTSAGGGGHMSTSKALHAHLEETYNVQSIYLFKSALKTIDPIYLLSFGYYSGEDTYNYCASRGWLFVLNRLYYFGAWYTKLFSSRAQKLIELHINKHTPDLIISVIPLMNNTILNIANKHNIPFLLIPTDLDATTFLDGITAPQSKNFYVAISFDNPDIKNAFNKAKIPQQCIHIAGFPLREQFFEQKNIPAIKKHLSIPEGRPVIVVLLGFRGSRSMVRFAQELAALKSPAHIVFCAGTNEVSQQKIEELLFPKHISKTVLGFTKEISDVMAVADLFITKSGSISVYEALYMNLPMLFDATTSVLLWEQFNHHFIKKNGFGDNVTDYTAIAPITEDMLNPQRLRVIKNNLHKLKKLHGCNEIRLLIEKILHT